MKINIRFRKFIGTFQTYGIADGLLYLFTRLLAFLNNPLRLVKYGLFIQPVSPKPLIQARPGRTISVRRINIDQYRPEWFDRPVATIEGRYRQGSVCFVAFDIETPVGCIWLCPDRYLEDEVKCRYLLHPQKQIIWDYDIYVSPQYRLGRTFLYLVDAAHAWLREQGYRWSASRIDAFNSESLKAHRRLGAFQVGTLIFLLRGNWQLMMADVPPYFHFSTADHSLPNVRVSHGER